MSGLFGMLNGLALTLYFNAKDFFVDEFRQIKDDENGMEMVQFLIITAFVVVVAGLLITLLITFIQALIAVLVGEPY